MHINDNTQTDVTMDMIIKTTDNNDVDDRVCVCVCV